MPTVVSSGNDYNIKNISLTDAYQDVTLPTAVKSFSIQVRGDVNKVLWRKSASDTGEWTFKEGQTYSIDGSRGAQAGTTITIGQAKCSSVGATDTLEIWYWYI